MTKSWPELTILITTHVHIHDLPKYNSTGNTTPQSVRILSIINASDFFQKSSLSRSQQMGINWTQWFPVLSTPHCCWPRIAAIRPGFDNLTTWWFLRSLKNFKDGSGDVSTWRYCQNDQQWILGHLIRRHNVIKMMCSMIDLDPTTCEKIVSIYFNMLHFNQTKKKHIHLFTSVQAAKLPASNSCCSDA